jgi:peptidoglycan/xylan/chitin deacetylase (PgdA/CDA1 family)
MKGIGHFKKAFRTLRRRYKPGAVILLYHRVAKLPGDPYSLAVSPDHFAQQLDYIRQTSHPMRLVDLAEAIQQGSLPQRAVAITFDDGYVDNFTQAYPLLKAAQIPATIFVTSEQIDSPREFWWDDLERMLLLPTQLPKRLQITIGDQAYVWPTESKEYRLRTHQAIHKLLRPIDAIARDNVLGELANWSGLERTGRSDYRAMTVEELIELARSGYIDLGGHTKTHPVLSALSRDVQYGEIVGGFQRLASIIGSAVPIFAYPYGSAQDFGEETVDIVRDAGFLAACTTMPSSIEAGADLLRLRRCPVSDWNIETFKRQLESWVVA